MPRRYCQRRFVRGREAAASSQQAFGYRPQFINLYEIGRPGSSVCVCLWVPDVTLWPGVLACLL